MTLSADDVLNAEAVAGNTISEYALGAAALFTGGVKAATRAVWEYTYSAPSHTTSPQEPCASTVEALLGADVPSMDVKFPSGRTATAREPTSTRLRNTGSLRFESGTLTTVTKSAIEVNHEPL